MVTAKLIGEASAGDIIVQIYDNDTLVWSHSYTQNGCSDSYYQNITKKVVAEDMINSADYTYYDGCDLDDDGDITDYLTGGDTYGVVAEFCEGRWSFGARDYGLTGDVVIAGRKIADIINE